MGGDTPRNVGVSGFYRFLSVDWYAFDRRVLDALGLEPEERIAGFVHIGTARETPADRARPALADIVTWI